MTKYLLILSLLLTSFSFSQSVKVDDKFELEVKRVDHRSRLFQVHFKSYYIRVPKDTKKIQFRIKAKSLSNKNESFDPNKFYVLLNDEKVRLRAFDGNFAKLVDIETDSYDYSYKPEIVDTFKDYQIEGYSDIESCIDFGTKKKPDVKPIYFDHAEIKSGSFNIYFAIPKDQKKFEFYYGTIKLLDYEID